MPTSIPLVPTVGSIAAQFGVPVHRIVYIIRSRGIEPTGKAGCARVFTQEDVERIAGELKRMQQDKAPHSA